MIFRISREVKIASWATAILWFGWGFGESLIPVFLYQFSNSYAESGLLKSVYDITALLVIPLIGYYADRISTRKMMLVGIGLYFLIAFNYYLAGALACALFIVIARFINGFAWPLTRVSQENYICNYTPKDKVARAFGYFDTLTVVAWAIAVCSSLFLVSKLAIYQLLFFIAPAAAIAFIVAWFLPRGPKLKKIGRLKFNFLPYRGIIKEIMRWPLKLKTVILSGLLISFVSSAFFFFIPIEVWKTGSDLKQVIILAIFYSLPEAAGSLLGWVVDKIKVNKSLFFCFFGLFTVTVLSIFFTNFIWRLTALLLFGIFIETIVLARRQLIVDFNKNCGYGSINAILGEVTGLGELIGVILVGVIIDFINLPAALILMSLILVLVFAIFIKNKIISRESIITE